MFVIKQDNDNIEVFYKEVLYMEVKRKFNLLGRMTSLFIIDQIIVLESTYDIFFFMKFLTIKNKNRGLIKNLELHKKNKDFVLTVDGLNLVLHRNYFRNPLYTIESCGQIIGQVNTNLSGLTQLPIYYELNLQCDKELEVYCLFRFLIELPPVMDV